ncbi:MAG: RING-HC finger protein [Promethearchaeota archaeon]|nr:MAG: RING-HC finger protein [Candidatus Lokiarchaeota archaeon]
MAIVMIWNPIYLILFGILILIDLLIAMQYFNTGRKIPNIDERLISYAYSFLFFCFSLSMVFLILSELQIQGTFINNTFYGDLSKGNELYQLFFRLFVLFHNIAFTFFYYVFGRYKKKLKYFLLIFNAFGLISSMVLPIDLMMKINSFYAILNTIIFLSILLIYTRWSQLELKASSSFIFLGSYLIFLAVVFNYPEFKQYGLIPLILPLILYILGALIILAPTVINPKSLSNPLTFWKINGILSIFCSVILLFFIIIFISFFDFIFLAVFFTLYTICSVLLILKSIKSQLLKTEKTEHAGVLRSFSRPERITEEEVSISKEKKVCLVCKGKVRKFDVYICDCNTFYCENCARALINLENACWVCNTPIDVSKPSKSFKKEDEIDIEISEKSPKKQKIDKKKGDLKNA